MPIYCVSLFYYFKVQLELSVRVSDLKDILVNDEKVCAGNECKKGILSLFNEYKIVLESTLFELSIPFLVTKK